MKDHVFKYSLAASLFLHLAALVQLSYNNSHYFKRPITRIEVVYTQPEPKPLEIKKNKEEVKSITQTKLPEDAKLLLRERKNNISPVRDIVKPSNKFKLDTKLSSKINPLGVKRKVSVPEIKSEKISNPSYLNYYQMVRGRIQQKAYENYGQLDMGQVYLTFVVLSDGSLKQIKLIDEKTLATEYLRNVGLRSIKDASPFPSFPQELKYPELSFNVVISFEAQK